jgi:serine/threonine protein phosphatase 1
MLERLRQILRPAPGGRPATLPLGQRAYAVGDIHGRADLFAALIDAIEADDARRGRAETTAILLGDLIDRGPDSAGVIELARTWQRRRPVRILAGNHEEMFLESFANPEVLRQFLRHGGRETLLSYPIDPADYTRAELEELQALMRAAVPPDDLAFIATFEDRIAMGDYLFVHAGIRPGVSLEQQRTEDLRWIRGTFLDHAADFGFTVIHGHSIVAEADVQTNRIGIDTGAFASGRLTALGLEEGRRWLIEAHEHNGEITLAHRSI